MVAYGSLAAASASASRRTCPMLSNPDHDRQWLSLAWAVVVGVVGICVFAQMSGRVAAVSGRATFEHGSSQGWPALLGGPAGIGHHRRVDRTGLGGRKAGPGVVWAGRETWDLPGDHCGICRVLTISLQIMINLRFSL